MSCIEVQEEKRDRAWVVRIDPFFDPKDKRRGFQAKVTVFSDKDWSHEDHEFHWRRAHISWSSIGGVSFDETSAFASALHSAVAHAQAMDAEHGFLKVETKKC